MSTLTPTLVVVVTNRHDWRRVVDEGWYRIPLQHAPDIMAAHYLAFYFTRHFGNDAWHVAYYAPVLRYNLLQRRDIMPDEADHPRADHWYYRVALNTPRRLSCPVPSRSLRRVTFIPTTLEQLQAADDVTDLWKTDDAAATVWTYFPDAAIKATRRLALEERRHWYPDACRERGKGQKSTRSSTEERAPAPRRLAPKAASPLATKPSYACARLVPKIVGDGSFRDQLEVP